LRSQHDRRGSDRSGLRDLRRGARGLGSSSLGSPPLPREIPPFSERGKPPERRGQRGVLNFILHPSFFLAFSKIPDLPQ
jgi:hypothetical protein